MRTTIGELFDVGYGQKEYESKGELDSGTTLLISSKGEDNGCYGFFNIKAHYKPSFISVPRTGSIGEAFVQESDCCIDNNCLVLLPKKKLSILILYQVAYQIRTNKWRYKYGRQITPQRIKKQMIIIKDTKLDYKKYFNKLIPSSKKKTKIKENKNMKWIKLTELCNIEKKSALPQNKMELNGKTPYVTTSSKNNGVSNFVNESPNTKARCLTIALNGSVAETFFQFDDFITSGDNAVLTLKGKYNPYLLMFIGFMIEKQKWKYNYYQKLSLRKLKDFKIPLPFNKKGEIDLNYIKSIIESSFGFEELKKYL